MLKLVPFVAPTDVAKCNSPICVGHIDRRTFLFLVHESPTFALGIMGALASRLRDYDERFGRLERRE